MKSFEFETNPEKRKLTTIGTMTDGTTGRERTCRDGKETCKERTWLERR